MSQEDTNNTQDSNPQHTKAGHVAGRLLLVLRIVLPVLVLAVAIFVGVWLIETKPQAKTTVKQRIAMLVEVKPVRFTEQTTMIPAMGTVQPARQLELRPQVSGQVISMNVNMVPGGILHGGELLLKIDPTDYRLQVRELTSEVAKAEAELQLEQGNQLVAQREYELLGESVSATEQALMLRKPQLENLKASLEAARAKLEQAEVDLQRTEINVPFNAVIQSRDVNLGSRVNESTTLATLAGTNEYWVEVSLPVSLLRWIDIPRHAAESGSPVTIYDQAAWGPDASRSGRVIRLAAGLEETGRMARLLVSVSDPLALEKPAGTPRLLIGSYVRTIIKGRPLPHAVALKRELLRDGDTVWVMNNENRLDIRPVTIAFRNEDTVLITAGLAPGERLVTSNLPAPVAGMALRLQDEPPAEATASAPTAVQGSAR